MAKHHSENVAKLDSVDWETWLHKPGMPPIDMPFDQKLANACSQLAKRWVFLSVYHFLLLMAPRAC